jgi:hypothetical protein
MPRWMAMVAACVPRTISSSTSTSRGLNGARSSWEASFAVSFETNVSAAGIYNADSLDRFVMPDVLGEEAEDPGVDGFADIFLAIV